MAYRLRHHDNLVLAVTIAGWCGERYLRKEDSFPRPGEWASEGVPTTIIGRGERIGR
jgi:hypothetical protein